jgi:hypothetical protein
MAEKLNLEIGEGHNNGPMSDEEKMQAVKDLDTALEPLESAVQAAQKAVTSAHRDFKTKTGITRKDFDFGRRLAKIEDEDEQKEKTDAVSLVFNAISQNTQLSFFDNE